jgi:hypothetical protein
VALTLASIASGACAVLAVDPTPPARAASGGAGISPGAGLTGQARLSGTFVLAGRITTAVRVPGERPGQTVLRNWTFTPQCANGVCAQIGLARQRGPNTDNLLLDHTGPATYSGSGSFFAALKCGTRTYTLGARVPFTVTVTITAAVRSSIGVLATRVSATYTNRRRINRTPCVGVLGHDAATYHGHVASF